MTNLHPITLSGSLPAIEHDLAERRAAANTASTLRAISRAARTSVRAVRASVHAIAPRLIGAA